MSDRDEGPLMLAATDVLRTPPMRIAKLFGNVVLPRSVQVRALVAGGVGGTFGLLIGVVFIGVFGLQGMLFSGVIGAALAVIALQWQPQPGENLFQVMWVRARASSRQQKVSVDGRSVPLYIGVARLERTAAGHVELRSGAVPVRPGSVDERGALRSEKNRNLEQAHTMAGYPAAGVAAATRLMLPDNPGATPSSSPAHKLPGPRELPSPVRSGGRLAMPDDTLGLAHAPETSPRSSRLAMPDSEHAAPHTPEASIDAPAHPAAVPPRRSGRLAMPDDPLGNGDAATSTSTRPTRLPLPDEPSGGPPAHTAEGPASAPPARPRRLNLPD